MRCITSINTLLLSLWLAVPAHAEIFFQLTPDGIEHYSDEVRNESVQAPVQTTVPLSTRLLSARQKLTPAIAQAALRSGVEAALLHAIITVESGYNSHAISPKGAQGLMQLMPMTARQYGVRNALNTTQNLQGGAHLMRDLLKKFDNNKALAIAAYNAGAGAVLAHGKRIPPYPETMRYVPAVLKHYALLRSATP